MATGEYGGYEYSFVDKQEVEKFTCAICTRVFKNPRQTGCCGQVFCGSCLHFWFTKNGGNKNCPHCRAKGNRFNYFLDKRLKREIDSLTIHCTNKEEGCQWIGELGSLKDHLESANGCDYVKVGCPNKCGKKSKRKDLRHHLEDMCSLRPYQCKYCGFRDTYTNITGHGGKTNFHYKQCTEFPLECPNKCGRKNVKRKNMEDHRSQCPEEEIKCPNGCGGWHTDSANTVCFTHTLTFKRKDLNRHLKEECELRPYKCVYCGLKDTYISITTKHYIVCTHFPLECPNKCGRKEIKRKDMKDHRSQCPEEMIQCPFEKAGCEENFVRRNLEQHMSATQQKHRQLIDSFKIKIAALLKQNTELEEAVEAKGVENSRLSEKLLHTKQQNSRLDAKNTQLEQVKSAMQQENSKFKQEISRIEKDKQQFQQERSRMQEEHSNLGYEISRLKNMHTMILAQNDEIIVKNEKLEEESTQLRHEASITAAESLKLKQEISRLKDGLDEAFDSILELDQAKYTAKEENMRLENEMSQQLQDIDRIQQVLSDEKWKNLRLQTKSLTLEHNLDSIQQELSDEQQQNSRLKWELINTTNRNQKLKEDLDSTSGCLCIAILAAVIIIAILISLLLSSRKE